MYSKHNHEISLASQPYFSRVWPILVTGHGINQDSGVLTVRPAMANSRVSKSSIAMPTNV